jgi:hypothetical protein
MPRKLLILACSLAMVAVSLAGTAHAASRPIFSTGALVDTDPNTGPVTIGHVNADGFPDLVSRSGFTDSVAVRLGTGDGTFEPRDLYSAGGTPYGEVAIGDVTGDGVPDLAVANLFTDGVRVLPGPLPEPQLPEIPESVPGAFLAATGDEPVALAAGQLNGAGPPDLVVGNAGDGTVSVLLADGTGSFQPKVDYPAGGAMVETGLALGDVDGSGTLDIVVANQEADTVSVLLGNADGTFGAASSFGGYPAPPFDPALFDPTSVALGDLDGEGDLDLVVGQWGDHGLTVFLGDGQGAFVAQDPSLLPSLDVREKSVTSVEIADLDLDGNADVVVGIHPVLGAPPPDDLGHLGVLVGLGDGTFSELADYPFGMSAGSAPAGTAVGDLNLDARPDLAVTWNGLWTLLNTSGPVTPAGQNVVVSPIDPATGSTPLTITFANVSSGGQTTVASSSAGPTPPSGFAVQGSYYEIATTAVFDVAEVCFPYVYPPAPTIVHWVGGVPDPNLTSYFRDASGALAVAAQGVKVCAEVTSFSPFALVVPAGGGDTTAPTVACGAADGVWHADNVSIDCTAQDDGSGLADPADAAFALSTSVPAGEEDGDASTDSRQVCDAAGNCAPAGPIGGNKIDRKAPELSLPADMTVNASSPAGAEVSFSASASDGADPNPGVSCTPGSGSTFAIGTATVTCTATDQVGNSAGGSFMVTVLGAREQLLALIEEVVTASQLPPAIKTQLTAKLQALVASFDPSNPQQVRAVCRALQIFRGVVQLLSGHGIPPAQAAEWVADANRIRAVLSC